MENNEVVYNAENSQSHNPNIIHNLDSEDIALDLNNDFIVNISEVEQDSSNGIQVPEQNDRNTNMQFAKNIVILTQEDVKEDPEVNKFREAGLSDRDSKCNMKTIGLNGNELILFFFINPTSGSGSGNNVLNMEVKKVEFMDTLGCVGNPRCTAYITDLHNEAQCQTGIGILKLELSRGKF